MEKVDGNRVGDLATVTVVHYQVATRLSSLHLNATSLADDALAPTLLFAPHFPATPATYLLFTQRTDQTDERTDGDNSKTVASTPPSAPSWTTTMTTVTKSVSCRGRPVLNI